MIKIVVIDDEPLARSIVVEYLQSYPEVDIVQECNNGYEGLKAIQQHKPDLIFLDIQMPKISGFEMLELVEEMPAVIFTTAFDEYAMRAFEANAVDYLLKPFSKERFDKAFQKFLQQRGNSSAIKKTEDLLMNINHQAEEQNRIVVKNGSDIRIVPIDDICYIEAFDDYVKIFTKDSWYLKKKTMSSYEASLNEKQFLRVHRSFIINLQELTRIEPMEKNSHIALLKTGQRIPLSRSGYSRLKEKLGI
ncbi:MAG: LytR family transcriptional regulator [Bacteroidetes bacterium]|jgi:two-component system LytT family response regulator|nr:LytR family transcriptional regulator [Bacteroidota bacterium]